MIRLHCDICSREMLLSQSIDISTKTFALPSPESKGPQELPVTQGGKSLGFDVCSPECARVAFKRIEAMLSPHEKRKMKVTSGEEHCSHATPDSFRDMGELVLWCPICGALKNLGCEWRKPGE